MKNEITAEQSAKITENISKYIDCKINCFTSDNVQEQIKELCVAKLCQSIGIECKYNYKSDFFEFFSCIIAQAVCENLNINIQMAPDSLRLVRYNHVNIIEHVKMLLKQDNKEEAFLNIFNFVDHFSYLMDKYKS